MKMRAVFEVHGVPIDCVFVPVFRDGDWNRGFSFLGKSRW